jgi:hypothetical protein
MTLILPSIVAIGLGEAIIPRTPNQNSNLATSRGTMIGFLDRRKVVKVDELAVMDWSLTMIP